MTRDMVWRLLCWSLVAAWLMVIWQFGESHVLPLTSDDVPRWLLRKELHLTVYGVLGGLLVLALGPRWRWQGVVILCLLVALGDEVHQRFVPGRSFHVYDIGIDLLGGMVGILFSDKIVNLIVLW